MKNVSILFIGSPPPSTYIRAMPIFKLPEHAKDIVRCCPNHTLLDQTTSRGKATNTRCSIARNVLGNRCFLYHMYFFFSGNPASGHFIRSDNPQAEYQQCIHSGRQSVRIPFKVNGKHFYLPKKTMSFNCT